ncbi:response regulator transcription factor [Streptomyces sp. WAC08241]|uniref:response regulator transcription factor n=1 Tax=Streptomyces sp. WAC08241 TaxID=2487421 RepID=UPI000F7B2D24|nr:response regulator transcription factor [Streptomyces sp. WAC08241]RSS34240.1 DNA-binding response regulator [Streptomyces sp. WAC08241]
MPDDTTGPGPTPLPEGFPALPDRPPVAATPLRVVVADDNPVVRAGLSVLLSGRDDIEVVAESADGRQAYEATVRHRPDVVLLDVRMPGVDGISALPHLVRIAPVLMMTYSRESEIVHEALRLGAGGYLVHGEFTADQLVEAVRDTRRGRAHFTHSASAALLESLRGGAPGGRAPGRPLPEGLGRAFAVPDQPSATAYVQEQQPGSSSSPMRRHYREVDSTEPGSQSSQTHSLLQANVGQSSPGPQADGAVLSELSRREAEVMDLIASGMTNQQIAATCFISQKTVKNHINRIFAKLDAGSRGEAIARWNGIARRGAPRHD